MTISKQAKGFTLIELMIVVAIIGILAAIAIPQFATYRTKAFNSAASSDAKTGVTILESFYTDNNAYPSATQMADSITNTSSTAPGSLPLSASTSWNLSVSVDAVYDSQTQNYVILTKHYSGDQCFTADSNTPTVRKLANDPGTPGVHLASSNAAITAANVVTTTCP